MKQKLKVSENESTVIEALLYYEVFNYPLTANEVFYRSTLSSKEILSSTLQLLTTNGLVQEKDGFYFIDKGINLNHRLDLNQRALEILPETQKHICLIASFPFVKAVLISGSLSKGCMEENGDVDYLVITTTGRLWVCRMLLTLYKKFFLLNSRKYFCVNYYLTETELEVPDSNIFTATEINSCIPVYNKELADEFKQKNSWVRKFFPNQPSPDAIEIPISERKNSALSNFIEFMFGGFLGEFFDKTFFKIFLFYWKFKYGSQKEFEVNFRSRRTVSKHHPQGFQFKVLKKLEEKIVSFESLHNCEINCVYIQRK